MSVSLLPRIHRNRRILFRALGLCWTIILCTVVVFVLFFLPYQKKMLVESISVQGKLTFTSLEDVLASSVVLEDYSAVVEHCMSVVRENPSILYIVLTRNDGFSLIHTEEGWSQKALDGMWNPSSNGESTKGNFIHCPFVDSESYNYSSLLKYSGIDCGWIHIGLSLKKYYVDQRILYYRIFQIALLAVSLGFVSSYFFVRRLSRPIQLLNEFTQKAAMGDLSQSIRIETGDEFESLAESFNAMMQSLKKSQDRLVETRDYVENILHSMNDMLLVADSQYNIRSANRAARELLGFEEEEIVGRSLFDLFDDCASETEDLSQCFRGISVSKHETSCRTKEGKQIPVLLSCSTLSGDAERRSDKVVIALDITERKRLETQLIHAQKMEAIGRLAGGVAHNINNLLTGIIGYQQLALIKANQDIVGFLTNAGKAAERATDLVKELLVFSRKGDVQLKPLQLNAVVKELYQLIRQTFSSRIEIELHLRDDLPLVLADNSQMHSILMNFCLNARDAIEMAQERREEERLENGSFLISIQTDVQTVCAQDGNDLSSDRYIVLSVTDNGIGIDDRTKKRIFEPFFTTKKNVGNGLGLASAFRIVKLHNGWIDFSSEYGKGTTFRMYLPANYNISELDECQPEKNENAPLRGRGETILFVDDEEVIRNLGEEHLTAHGYRVILACDGKECIDLYERRRDEIDLVIVDLSMPQLGGVEVLKVLRNRYPHIKIVISSGYIRNNDARAIREYGALDIVSKPYQPTDLLRKVRSAIDS